MLNQKTDRITYLLNLIHNYVIVDYYDYDNQRMIGAEELLVTKLRNLYDVLIMQSKLITDISSDVFTELDLIIKLVEEDLIFLSPNNIKDKILTILKEIK